MKSFTMKLLLGVASAATLFTTAALADDAGFGTLSGSVALQSDYRFRGISQNNRQPSPEFGLTFTGPDGFYVGTWEAKTNWIGTPVPYVNGTPSYEADFFGGKHTDLDGTDLNIEAYYYSYPDYSRSLGALVIGVNKTASYFEAIGQLSHAFDALTLTATGSWSPEWSLGGGTGWYVEGTAAYAATDWLSISANVGHQWVELAPSAYTHWDIGATATYKSVSLDVRYVDTDLSTADCGFYMITKNACKATVVATLTYNIASIP